MAFQGQNLKGRLAKWPLGFMEVAVITMRPQGGLGGHAPGRGRRGGVLLEKLGPCGRGDPGPWGEGAGVAAWTRVGR